MSSQLGVMKNDGELRALIVRGQELGFLGLEEVAEVLDGLGLDAEAAEEVYQQLEEAGIDLLSRPTPTRAPQSTPTSPSGPAATAPPSSRRPTRCSCSSRTSAACRS